MSNKNKNKKTTKKVRYGFNSTNAKKQEPTPEESARKTRRIIIIAVCVILALAILLGAVLGIVTAVRNASYVMKLDRVGIDKGVASFLISLYKYEYIASYSGASDSDTFWNKARVTGTEGDLFNYEATEYLKEIVAANALFDQYAELTSEDKKRINLATKEVLNFKASGSEKTFNEKTAEFGFDFDDFKRGSEMIYKASVVATRVFGEGGANMQTMFGDWCNTFYENNYIKAKILIIRTEDTFAYEMDENGDFVLNEKGEKIPIYETDAGGNKIHATRPLTAEEKAERLQYVNELKSLEAALKENPNATITRNKFNNLLTEIAEKYNENVTSAVKDGYYLMRKSYVDEKSGTHELITTDYTGKLNLDHIVRELYSRDEGEIYSYETGAAVAEDVESSFSYVCFAYRMEKPEGAYADSTLEHFFWDFNSLAAYFLYVDLIKEKISDVELKKKWDGINPVSIPVNKDIYVAEF